MIEELDLVCSDIHDREYRVRVEVELDPSGIRISVPGYDNHLCVVVEYYDQCLQLLAWGDETLFTDGDAHKYVLSSNVSRSKEHIDEIYKEDEE